MFDNRLLVNTSARTPVTWVLLCQYDKILKNERSQYFAHYINTIRLIIKILKKLEG